MKNALNIEDYIPLRFGLQYNPPMIIIEYKISSNGKLYHHKMKLRRLCKDSEATQLLEYLKNKHFMYFKDFEDKQVSTLIAKLIEFQQSNGTKQQGIEYHQIDIKKAYKSTQSGTDSKLNGKKVTQLPRDYQDQEAPPYLQESPLARYPLNRTYAMDFYAYQEPIYLKRSLSDGDFGELQAYYPYEALPYMLMTGQIQESQLTFEQKMYLDQISLQQMEQYQMYMQQQYQRYNGLELIQELSESLEDTSSSIH